MEPGDLCSKLLHSLSVRPRCREGSHVLELAGGQPLHLGECLAEVAEEPIDHLGAPTEGLLALPDLASDLPLEQHQLAVHGHRRPHLRRLHPLLERFEDSGVFSRARVDLAHDEAPILQPSGSPRPFVQHAAAQITSDQARLELGRPHAIQRTVLRPMGGGNRPPEVSAGPAPQTWRPAPAPSGPEPSPSPASCRSSLRPHGTPGSGRGSDRPPS